MKITCPYCGAGFETQAFDVAPCPSCGRAVEEPVLFASTLGGTREGGGETPDAILRPGMRLGRYEIVAKIGHGGMGEVWRGRDVELGREVAVKTMRADGAQDQQAVVRFLREARAAANLEHPNIVQVHDVGMETGIRFYVMEWIDGRSLAKLLDEEELPPRRAAEIVRDIARALDHAHRRGILHRDLKPGNILLTSDGTPKLADFGLTKTLGDVGLTATSEVIGTPNYMSPEQVRSTRNVDVRSDVYSLGAVLYESLTGLPPFQGAHPLEIMRRVEREEPITPSRLRRVPRDLEVICLKALSKEPSQRYATAADFAEDLDRWLRGEPVLARPAGPILRLRRWARRHPVVATAGLLVGLGAAVVGGLLWLRHRERMQAQQAQVQRMQRELEIERAVAAARIPYDTAMLMDDPATRARRRELLTEALRRIDEALGRVGDAAPLYFWRGRILEARGEREAALEAFGRAIQKEPQQAEARYRRVFLAFFDRLMRRIDTLPYLNSAQRRALQEDVAVIRRHGRPDQVEAAQALAALSEIYSAGLNIQLGAIWTRLEHHAAQAVAFNPVNVEARLLRAQAGLMRILVESDPGQRDVPLAAEVLEDLDRAMRLQPNDSLVRHQRFFAFLLLGRTAEAAAEVEHLLQISPGDDSAYVARALVRLALGGRAAWEDLDRALELTRDRGRVHALRALAHAGLLLQMAVGAPPENPPPDLAGARQELKEALEAEPPFMPARFYRAWLRARYDLDFAGALEDLRAYLQVEPENPQAQRLCRELERLVEPSQEPDPVVLAERARSSLAAGAWEEAARNARRAIEAISGGGGPPVPAERRRLLAEMWFVAAAADSGLGKVNEAMLALESAVAEGFGDWARLEREPALRAVREDERFPALLERWRGGQEF